MPRWWTQINKRVFNPSAVKKGTWPVLTHTGRTSGATYRTPLGAEKVDGGYLFLLVYSSRSDWVRNVLAAGTATLRVDGEEVELVKPRVLGREEAMPEWPEGAKPPPRFPRIDEFLRMDVAS